MINRRRFTASLAGALAAPGVTFAQAPKGKPVLYSGVGPDFTQYDVDAEALTLTKRSSVKLPGGVQYAWRHPAKGFLYVSSSTGGPGQSGNEHFVTAFKIDPATGALQLHGAQLKLRWRPVHNSVDHSGDYLLVAYAEPAAASVHRINADGTIGEEMAQAEKLDFGVYGHQITATPTNQSVILITRGNDAAAGKPEDPGSLKVYGFKNGVLSNRASVQPGTGLGFGPRHLDYHPAQPWVLVSVERQNKLYVYALQPDGSLSKDPLFVKDTVADPGNHNSSAGPIHVHPNGRFVYVSNRAGWGSTAAKIKEEFEGKKVFGADESSIAVFAIDQQTGEPKLVELAPARGAHPRTFSIDPTGRMLVSASLVPIAVRAAGAISVVQAGLSVFRIGEDGRLAYARRYDIETGKGTQWWSGMAMQS